MVPKVKLFKEGPGRERSITVEEAETLLAKLPEHQRDVVTFTLATGLRQSNVLDLEWSHVDLEARHAWVGANDSKNGKPITVPLNATALEVLRRQLGKHPQRVFTYAGKPLATANTRAWRKALKRAGIENFRWHDTRHTWATWHRRSGTPTHELQRLGGWRSSVMVERYAHAPTEYHGPSTIRQFVANMLALPSLALRDFRFAGNEKLLGRPPFCQLDRSRFGELLATTVLMEGSPTTIDTLALLPVFIPSLRTVW